MSNIHFFTEDYDYEASDVSKKTEWIKQIIKNEGYVEGEINYIFCSDKYLHTINVDYLQHDNYTDIITFDQSDDEKTIEGDIFISVERVSENNETFQTTFEKELLRVMAHGLLHLMGYKDKEEKDITTMRAKEESCLSIYLT